MLVFFIFIFLPLLEISGFVIIGGKIGLGWSLLWVVASTIAGFRFLLTMGGDTLRRAKKSVAEDVYPFEEMFDGLCILLGALLLIFPGFASDFLALPLLWAPARRGIFAFLKHQHQGLFDSLSKGAKGATYWYYEERKSPSGTTTIEGSFQRTDDRDLLSK